MLPFSAFGFLLAGFLAGVVVCAITGSIAGCWWEGRKHTEEWVKQEMELRRVRQEHERNEVTRLVSKLIEGIDMGKSPEITHFLAPFPVKNSCNRPDN